MNPMGTTNQKPTIDTQKLERKEHRHTTKEDIKPQRKKQKEEWTENYKNNQKTSVIKWQ